MFEEKGYEFVKNFFNPSELLEESNKIINLAYKKKWKYIKVYHNIFLNNKINSFCISFPFNKYLNSNLLNKLEKINYKPKLLKITKFNDLSSSAIELQHNQKFNYQSTWHRDWESLASGNIVLILFLTDEKGFRIIPKNLEANLRKDFPDVATKNYKIGYKKIPKKYFEIIDAKAGDFLVFDAGLLHQGFAKGKRTHLFIRHNSLNESENEKVKYYSKYNFKSYLRPDADLSEIDVIANKDTFNFNINYFSLKNKIKSIFNLIIYYFPLIKFLKFILDFKRKNTHFHYSIFQ